MTTVAAPLAGVELNEEGFFIDPGAWDVSMVPALAAREGIGPLTDDHWLVIRFMRRSFVETGAAPNVRLLSKEIGIPIKELYQLFPKGPAKVAARIAGVPKPQGCI